MKSFTIIKYIFPFLFLFPCFAYGSEVTPQALALTISKTKLNIDTNATIRVNATYKDKYTKDVTDKVEWLFLPEDSIKIKNNTLIPLKETKVGIRAKLGNKISNHIIVSIYWEVDGYRLPPEPDPKNNNSTLHGIDSNNNGVRDDVERKIYAKYPLKLHRATLMDYAKFFQLTLSRPNSEAKEVVQVSIKNSNCMLFLGDLNKEINSDNWMENIDETRNLTFNTKARTRKYLDYNLALSGGVYGSSPADWNRDACSDEVKEVLKEMGL